MMSFSGDSWRLRGAFCRVFCTLFWVAGVVDGMPDIICARTATSASQREQHQSKSCSSDRWVSGDLCPRVGMRYLVIIHGHMPDSADVCTLRMLL